MRSRALDIGGRAAVALAVFCSWLWQFGLMGAEFNADSAVATAMAQRPFAVTSLYVWSQNRQGMALPLLARALHLAFGAPTHETLQLLFYLVAAVGLFLGMGLLSSWPLRLALASFLALPSYAMAQSLCNKYYLPAAFLLTVGQIYAFRAAAQAPTATRIAWAALLAGLLLWIAENCLVLFPAELWVVGLAVFRSRGVGIPKSLAAALGGAAVPAAIIATGKLAVPSASVWKLLRPWEAVAAAIGLAPQLRQLAPALGGGATYALLVALFAWAARELWLLRKRELKGVSALALLGTAPLLGLIGTSCSRHFEGNLRMSRYLSWPVLIAIVGGCLALERLAVRARRPAVAELGLWTATLALGIGCWLGRYSAIGTERVLVFGNESPGPQDEGHWRRLVALAADRGCQAMIGNHWDVYPFMALSEGRILASPVGPAAGIVNASLAYDTVRQKEVCRIRSQRPDPGPCQPTETYFGSKLRLLDELDEKVDGEDVHLCRFEPVPFADYCARATDLPRVATGSEGIRVLPHADGASAAVVELRQAIRFGPYMAVPAGQYRYVTRLSAVAPAGDAGVKLDVYVGGVLAERSVAAGELPPAGEWRIFSLPFTVPRTATDLELRTAKSQAGPPAVREDWIGLFKADGGPREGDDLRDPPCAAPPRQPAK